MRPGYGHGVPHELNTNGLLVCTGKHCRQDAGFAALVTLARGTPDACEVPCQSLCKGPVVGCRADGQLRWFTKVRSAKSRKAVMQMLQTGHVPERLRRRESRKRRGELQGRRRVRALSAP